MSTQNLPVGEEDRIAGFVGVEVEVEEFGMPVL